MSWSLKVLYNLVILFWSGVSLIDCDDWLLINVIKLMILVNFWLDDRFKVVLLEYRWIIF